MIKEKMYVITEFNSNLQEARAIFVTKDKQLAKRNLSTLEYYSSLLEDYGLKWTLNELILEDDKTIINSVVDMSDIISILHPNN